eukprot:scaffold56_cov379-Prasinococcus_capsulatus_cf.AAC.6
MEVLVTQPIDVSLEDFFKAFLETADFAYRVAESCGDEEVEVSDWQEIQGQAGLVRTMCCERTIFDGRRIAIDEEQTCVLHRLPEDVGEHAYQLVFDGVHVRPLHGEEAEPGNEFEVCISWGVPLAALRRSPGSGHAGHSLAPRLQVWSRIDVREEAGGTCSVQGTYGARDEGAGGPVAGRGTRGASRLALEVDGTGTKHGMTPCAGAAASGHFTVCTATTPSWTPPQGSLPGGGPPSRPDTTEADKGVSGALGSTRPAGERISYHRNDDRNGWPNLDKVPLGCPRPVPRLACTPASTHSPPSHGAQPYHRDEHVQVQKIVHQQEAHSHRDPAARALLGRHGQQGPPQDGLQEHGPVEGEDDPHHGPEELFARLQVAFRVEK